MAAAALPRRVFAGVLSLINCLRGPPDAVAPALPVTTTNSINVVMAAGTVCPDSRTNASNTAQTRLFRAPCGRYGIERGASHVAQA